MKGYKDFTGVVIPGTDTRWEYVSAIQEYGTQVQGTDGLWSIGADSLKWLAHALDTTLGEIGMIIKTD